jgi:hypothetical protein
MPSSWLQQQLQQQQTPVLVALAVGLATLFLFIFLRSKGKGSSGSGKPQGKGLPRSVAKAAYESLRSRELAWLRGLPRGNNKAQGSLPHVHALLHSGELGMVLLGVKPCAVVEDRRGGVPGGSFAAAFAEEVVSAFGCALVCIYSVD